MSLINEHVVKQEILKDINTLIEQCTFITVEDGYGRYGYLIENKKEFMMKIDELLEKNFKL